jgi:hypothetical protein
MTWAPAFASVNTRLDARGGIDMLGNQIANLLPPTQPTNAATRQYVDNAVAAVAAPSAFRTIVYMPDELTLNTTYSFFLDVNFPIPATGLRTVLVTVDPIFASNDPPGVTSWQVFYETNLIALESTTVAFKMNSDPTGFIRAPAKITAAVDASAGVIRVLVAGRVVPDSGSLIQVGVGGTIATTMRTLVSVQDLGPA